MPGLCPIRTDDRWDTDRPLKAGDRILGFTLTESLGQGGFARVFLADQPGVGNRTVVLKIAIRGNPEADRLGRLQHPNIVPVHSVHHAYPFSIICMPFLGRRTLADHVAARGTKPATAADVRWVLATLSALAGGLDHAHRRGILHLDVKPANVLMPDTGGPMLLDFNLAHDTSRGRRLAGGTLAYMAPEQIADMMARGHGTVEERTDLYNLGILAFELLTGRSPFAGSGSTTLSWHLEARRTAHDPRAGNRAVTPAVAAIVRKLLAFDPAERYQTALELKDDLDRQLSDRPLMSAPDRCPRERFRKWRRRNQWAMVWAAAACVTGCALALGLVEERRQASAKTGAARHRVDTFRHHLSTVRLDLTSPTDAANRQRGRAAAEEYLAAFGLPDNSKWRESPAFTRLPADQHAAAAADLGEVLLLMAHARWLDAKDATDADRDALVADAVRLNAAAAACFDADTAPAFLARQRAVLRGDTAESHHKGRTGRDSFLDAVLLIAEGKLDRAAAALDRAVAAEPNHAAAHFARAYCRHQLGQHAAALTGYETARALMPSDPRPAFNRGLLFGLRQDHAAAEEEFSRAVGLNPEHGDSYHGRAVARLRLTPANHRGAEHDLTAALERHVPPIRVYGLRAQARQYLSDRTGAEQDRRAAAEYAPRTEAEFLARGAARLDKEPAAALADFEAAAALNPASLPALWNQVHVLADKRPDPERALGVLARLVALHPDYVPARGARAVLLARVGKADEAHREAEEALRRAAGPNLTAVANNPEFATALSSLIALRENTRRDAATAGFGVEMAAPGDAPAPATTTWCGRPAPEFGVSFLAALDPYGTAWW